MEQILTILKDFSPLALAIVSPLIMMIGFGYLVKSGKINLDIETNKDDGNLIEIIKSFQSATSAMKQMSNDNMHELSNSVLDVVKIRFEAIESLIQNEIAFQNKNLVSGMREEIKIGLNNIGGLKYEIKETTKKLGQAVNSFDKICKNCEYKNKK